MFKNCLLKTAMSGKPRKLPRKWQAMGSTQRSRVVRPVATPTRRGVNYKMIEMSLAEDDQSAAGPSSIDPPLSYDPLDPMDPLNHTNIADVIEAYGPARKRAKKDSGSVSP